MSDRDTNYKQLSAELDDILKTLEIGDIDVDEAVKLYERGMSIAAQIDKYLKTAENTVSKVKAKWQDKAK